MNKPSSNLSDKQARQKALLAKLEGRLFRGSDLEKPKAEPKRMSFGEIMPGLERIETKVGTASKVVVRVGLDGEPSQQGVHFPFGDDARALRPILVAMLARDDEFRDIPLESIAFIDTETSGLSGGTGTYVFLVGIGFFEGDDFVVEQYAMEDYDEEAALVEVLRLRMADFEALVSYNGKSFDVPLLRTRFIFQRTPSVWELPHLDLLHLARRLWKRRLRDCSLGTVETQVLGIRRVSDVDGAMVPRIFFDYVRGIRLERMIPVFDHNAQDIVSLGSLLGRIGRMMEEPMHPDFAFPSDQIGLSKIFDLNDDPDQATACLEEALHRLRDPMTIHTVSMHLARTYKRRGQWEEACAVWEAQIESGPSGRVEPYIELAKYFEHRAKDHVRAQSIVEQAIRALGFREEMEHYISAPANEEAGESELDGLLHRVRRLQAHQTRQEKKKAKRKKKKA